MKGNRSLVAIALAIFLAILPSAIAVEKTSSKAAGPSPTTVVNTILSGSGAPAKTLGINGDFYIDTKNLNLYGPKTKGVWKIATSLKVKDVPVVANVIGESGAIGQTGAKGATGDKGATGATGAQGIQGLTGPIGITGLAGASGATGSAGTPGVAGVLKEIRELKVFKAYLVVQAHQVLPELKEILDRKVFKVHLAVQDHQVLKVQKEIQERRVFKA